jgi:hypothetical protein
VSVLDAYVAGQGVLEARLFGSVKLAYATTPDVARGELMRYLAELPWAPCAMLHNPHLRWCGIGPSAMEVSAESPGGPARVRLVFEHGDIVRIEADDRPRIVSGRLVPTPWGGRYLDYGEVNGWRTPTRAEGLLGARHGSLRVLAWRDNGLSSPLDGCVFDMQERTAIAVLVENVKSGAASQVTRRAILPRWHCDAELAGRDEHEAVASLVSDSCLCHHRARRLRRYATTSSI